MSDAEYRWSLALTALRLLQIDPTLKGILVSTAHGPVHQAFTNCINEHFRVTTIPASVSNERLQGALDINQTLIAGRPIYQSGLLDTSDGALLVTSAERLDTLTASVLSAHLDNPEARDTVLIALDESTDEEPGLADTAMADRLGMMIELPALPLATLQTLLEQPEAKQTKQTQTEQAQAHISHSVYDGLKVQSARLSILPEHVELDDDLLLEITLLAQRLGVDSLRALLFAVRVTRSHAALHERSQASVEDAAIAAQLVLAPRATAMESAQEPAEEEQQDQPADDTDNAPPPEESSNKNDPEPQNDTEQDMHTDDVGERLLEACAATLPQHLIADLVRGQKNNRTAGRDAAATGKGTSGRPTGVRRPRGSIRDQRLNILETLKAAAPKQRLRGNTPSHVQGKPSGNNQRLQVRSEDFRVTRFKQPTRTTTVFVVDASGSAALHRLAEAKGAVELLLAECYVRRDRVAMVSFRGTEACLELPPTRSLVRAKRELAGLPGGGGTPLAAGLDLAVQVVQQLKQAGETPVVVLMTDGKANIARNAEASRVTAMEDAHAAARALAATGVKCLFVDTAPRARPQARELAQSLQATYLPLPTTNTSSLPELIRG